MSFNSRFIAFLALVMMGTGMLYFACLLMHLPFVVTVVLALAGTALLGWHLLRSGGEDGLQSTPCAILHTVILLVGIFLITNRCYYLSMKYGGWDAWAMWNYHGAAFTDADHWQVYLRNRWADHPDYPPGLPALLAFFFRLTGDSHSLIVPYVITFIPTICIPVWIYVEVSKKSLLAAAAALLLFATDDRYLHDGITQYADTPLALFFLGAFIAGNYMQGSRTALVLAGAFIGGCLWMKNEGVVLAAIYLLFYAGLLLKERRWLHFLKGLAVPLLMAAVFSIFFAPANDMLSAYRNTSGTPWLDPARYQAILSFFTTRMSDVFMPLLVAFFLFALLCIAQRRSPGRQMYIVLLCLLAYLFIYAFTPYDLEWHMLTSFDRLIQQLMPAFIYVVALRLAGLPLSFRPK